MNVKKILVPTDFSPFADRALKEALEIAVQFNSTIYLVHVIRADERFKLSETFDEQTQSKIRAELEQNTASNFQKQISQYPLGQRIKINTMVRKGVPYREILEFEKTISADVIVISTHGRSGFEEFFFGSTAEKIVRRATCSVLIVKSRYE